MWGRHPLLPTLCWAFPCLCSIPISGVRDVKVLIFSEKCNNLSEYTVLVIRRYNLIQFTCIFQVHEPAILCTTLYIVFTVINGLYDTYVNLAACVIYYYRLCVCLCLLICIEDIIYRFCIPTQCASVAPTICLLLQSYM